MKGLEKEKLMLEKILDSEKIELEELLQLNGGIDEIFQLTTNKIHYAQTPLSDLAFTLTQKNTNKRIIGRDYTQETANFIYSNLDEIQKQLNIRALSYEFGPCFCNH